jgi:quinol monooxygenase YgiN
MLIVIAEFRMPVDKRAETIAALLPIIAATRKEEGCIAYAYAEDIGDPGLFRINEAWASQETFAAHIGLPAMSDWGRKRQELGMIERQATIYTVEGERRL